MIEIRCDNCGEQIKVPASAAGRNCRCPRCNALVRVVAGGGSTRMPSPGDTSDDIALNDADDVLGETDILPAVEEDVAPQPAVTSPDSWEKRLRESYRHHAARPRRATWPHTLALAGVILLILAVLATLIVVLTAD